MLFCKVHTLLLQNGKCSILEKHTVCTFTELTELDLKLILKKVDAGSYTL